MATPGGRKTTFRAPRRFSTTSTPLRRCRRVREALAFSADGMATGPRTARRRRCAACRPTSRSANCDVNPRAHDGSLSRWSRCLGLDALASARFDHGASCRRGRPVCSHARCRGSRLPFLPARLRRRRLSAGASSARGGGGRAPAGLDAANPRRGPARRSHRSRHHRRRGRDSAAARGSGPHVRRALCPRRIPARRQAAGPRSARGRQHAGSGRHALPASRRGSPVVAIIPGASGILAGPQGSAPTRPSPAPRMAFALFIAGRSRSRAPAPVGSQPRPPMQTDNGAAVDLTNCDREPIHLLGSVQPFGFLLAVSSATWCVTRASRNVVEWLGVEAADLLGRPLDQIFTARRRPYDPRTICKARSWATPSRAPSASSSPARACAAT